MEPLIIGLPLPVEQDAPREPLATVVICRRDGTVTRLEGLPLSAAHALQSCPAPEWASLRIITRDVDRFDQSA